MQNETVTTTVATEVAPVKLGRPVVEGSARQLKLAAIAARIEAGESLKRGRPVKEGSKRQEVLAKRAARVEAGGVISKGRPSDPNSARQKKLADRAARLAAGEVIAPGRPKENKPEVIEASIENEVALADQFMEDVEIVDVDVMEEAEIH